MLPAIDISDPLAFFSHEIEEDAPLTRAADQDSSVVERSLIFQSDFDFLAAALRFRQNLPKGCGRIEATIRIDEAERIISLTPPVDLDVRLAYLPKEVLPEDRYFHLTDDSGRVQKAIRDAALNPNSTWPTIQLLWELHPVVQWTEDWAIGAFGRHSAPILHLPDRFEENEVWVLLQAGYPNRRGYTPVHDWIAVRVSPEGQVEVKSRSDLMRKVGFERGLINIGQEVDAAAMQACLSACVQAAIDRIVEKRKHYEAERRPKLEKRIKELDALRHKHLSRIDGQMASAESSAAMPARAQRKALDKREFIESCFEEANHYVQEAFELGSVPFVQVAAVFCGKMTRFDHFPDKANAAKRPEPMKKPVGQYHTQPNLL